MRTRPDENMVLFSTENTIAGVPPVRRFSRHPTADEIIDHDKSQQFMVLRGSGYPRPVLQLTTYPRRETQYHRRPLHVLYSFPESPRSIVAFLQNVYDKRPVLNTFAFYLACKIRTSFTRCIRGICTTCTYAAAYSVFFSAKNTITPLFFASFRTIFIMTIRADNLLF